MRSNSPVLMLVLLAPIIAEFLFGATPISRIGSLVPLTFLYGAGAVLIRDLARRRDSGWWRVAVLGAAYAIIEEGLGVQSLFNPELFQAAAIGGRALGVNWIWTEWTVGYHIVWSLLIPILLVELLNPARRSQPWLGSSGLAGAALCYALGVVVVGIAFRRIIAPNFRADLTLLSVTGLVAFILVVTALAWPVSSRVRSVAPPGVGRSPSPWFVSLISLLSAGTWFGLLFAPSALKSIGVPSFVPALLAIGIVSASILVIRAWSAPERGWTDRHSLSLVLGALPISMSFGIFVVTAGNRRDQMGQVVGSIVALLLLGMLYWRLNYRARNNMEAAA